MPGAFPDRALVRSRQQLHRIGQVAVAGDRAVVIAIQTHNLGQDVSVTTVAFGA